MHEARKYNPLPAFHALSWFRMGSHLPGFFLYGTLRSWPGTADPAKREFHFYKYDAPLVLRLELKRSDEAGVAFDALCVQVDDREAVLTVLGDKMENDDGVL